MTNEELAIQVQRGDTEAVLPLWEAVERFVWREAHRWARAWERPDELQDLVQSGVLALYGACESYQPGRGKFLTWYGMYLKTAFSEVLGVRSKKRDPLQNAQPLPNLCGGWLINESGLYSLALSRMEASCSLSVGI